MRARDLRGNPMGPVRAGAGSQDLSYPPGRSKATPALGTGHFPGDGNKLRVGWDRGPWPGRAGLWGDGDCPCCCVTGAWAAGPWG